MTKWDLSPFDDDSWLIPCGLVLPTLALRLVSVREESRHMKESLFSLAKVAAPTPHQMSSLGQSIASWFSGTGEILPFSVRTGPSIAW